MSAANQILGALAKGCATTGQLRRVLTRGCVYSALQVLRRRGLVHSVEGVHELTPKGLAWAEAGLSISHGPSLGRSGSRQRQTLRAKAWRLLRLKGKASLDDLLFIVADGTEADAEKNLRRYLRALVLAGILVQTRSGWLLPSDANTGPEAPSWNTLTRTVTDINTGATWTIG